MKISFRGLINFLFQMLANALIFHLSLVAVREQHSLKRLSQNEGKENPRRLFA